MSKRRIDRVPPDGWVTKLRETFGIDDDATWEDILIECAQTKRLALRATKQYFERVGEEPPADQVLKTLRSLDGRLLARFYDYDYFQHVMNALAASPRVGASPSPEKEPK